MRSITMINENLKRLSGDSTVDNPSELDELNKKLDNINQNLDGILQRLSQTPAKKKLDSPISQTTSQPTTMAITKKAGDGNGNVE